MALFQQEQQSAIKISSKKQTITWPVRHTAESAQRKSSGKLQKEKPPGEVHVPHRIPVCSHDLSCTHPEGVREVREKSPAEIMRLQQDPRETEAEGTARRGLARVWSRARRECLPTAGAQVHAVWHGWRNKQKGRR